MAAPAILADGEAMLNTPASHDHGDAPVHPGTEAGRRAGRIALAVGGGWAAAVVYALAVTLRSLAGEDFDGLNNLAQLPLSLPWAFMVPRGTDHVANAWLDAGFGLANAALLYTALRSWSTDRT
jgi:hypothetical protein